MMSSKMHCISTVLLNGKREWVKGFNAFQYCVNDENVMFVASLEIEVY